MNLAVESITVIAEVFLAWYFFTGKLGLPCTSKIEAVFCYIYYGIMLTCATFLISIAFLRLLFIAVIAFVLSKIVYQKAWTEVAYTVLVFFVMSALADVICGGLLSLARIPMEHILGNGFVRLVYNGTSKIAHLVLLYMVLAFSKAKYDKRAFIRSIPLIVGHIFSLAICFQNFSLLSSGASPLIITLETFGLLYISVIVCYYVEIQKQSYEDKERALKAEQSLEIQRNYYQGVMERQEETRALWHDIKKYMIAMEALVESDKREEAQKCLTEIEVSIIGIQDSVDVENAIVNSILTYGVENARKKNIKLNMDVWVGKDLQILPSDLFVIIGNTIDNAIEACSMISRINDRVIYLTLHQVNRLLYYEIVNPYTEDMQKKKGSVHGYGLKNVERCVQKYDGSMECTKGERYYTVVVQLNV